MSKLFFIVGSPRSGTKIFRDTLEAHPHIKTTDHPLEEIWTTGQEDCPHEQYDPETITPEIRNRVRDAFKEKLDSTHAFVEKNVRNSLRVPYIREIFPDAGFIHIIRDGRDATASIRERWKNPIDWDYYLSLRGLQLSLRDIVYYSARLGWKFIRRLLKGRSHVDVWGPHHPGLLDDLKSKSLIEVCAKQWTNCVHQARTEGPKEKDSYFELRYETLMRKPREVLEPLGDFMNLGTMEACTAFGEKNFRSTSIGRWRDELNDDEITRVNAIIGKLQSELGYNSRAGEGQ